METLRWDMIGVIIGGLSFLLTLLIEWKRLGASQRIMISLVVGAVAFLLVYLVAPLLLPPTATPPANAESSSVNTSVSNSSDIRDIAAQTLGYPNLDDLMLAFGIPTEIEGRIFTCPNEETWCLGVYEEPGQPDFQFKNITNCILDGKQANGVSTIPVGFDGMVKGFTLRPCNR